VTTGRARLPLPMGTVLAADRTTSTDQDGTVVVGGAPRRLLRLTTRGAELAGGLLTGTPVGDPAAAALGRRLVDAGLAHPTSVLGDVGAIDVVVPARDRSTELDRCLAALAPHRVTVVDDGSRDADEIAEVAARHGAQVVRLDRNRGPAAARNAGLRATDAPVVAFVDSDCAIRGASLPVVARHLIDDTVAAVAPRILADVTAARGALAGFAAVRSPLDLGPHPALVAPGGQLSYVPATVLVVRRSAVEEVGGFDESLRVGEDVDLVWRLLAAGWSVRYDPSVTARHREPPTWVGWLRRRARYGASAGPLARRHGAAVAGPPVSVVLAARRIRRLDVFADLSPDARRRLEGSPAEGVATLGRWAAPVWLPAVAAVLTLRTPRLLPLVVVPAIFGRSRVQPGAMGVLRWAVSTTADDLAYGFGVWGGCVRARTVRPLLPRRGAAAEVVGSAGDGGRAAHDDARVEPRAQPPQHMHHLVPADRDATGG
jgi:hypothetical protein